MRLLKYKIHKYLLRMINKVQYPLLEMLFFQKRLYVYCFCNRFMVRSKKNNLGDDLNIDFLENIFGKTIIKPEFRFFKSEKTYSFIGSILEYVCEQKEKVNVWGTGFKYSKNNLSNEAIKKNTYLAVRGPLTREIVMKAGGTCPEIYGDPGILISHYFKMERHIKYKFGIIPHNTELKMDSVKCLSEKPDIKLLDIVHYSSLRDFLEQLNSCEYILSSSLHGIIFADSYNIPNLWVRFGSKIDGDGFKYRDYYLGAQKGNAECVDLSVDFEISDIIDKLSEWKPAVVSKDFVKSCPFDIGKKIHLN